MLNQHYKDIDMLKHIIFLTTLFTIFSTRTMENVQSGSEWHQAAQKRNLTNPILLRFVYASRNPGAASHQRMISLHPGSQKDHIWGLIGPQTFTLYDEAFVSMDHSEPHACIIVRAPNQQVYYLNFEKDEHNSATHPIFKVILEKIKDTSDRNQSLQHKDHLEVIKHLKEYLKLYDQVGKERLDTLENVAQGNVLTILADDLGIYLSKGNK